MGKNLVKGIFNIVIRTNHNEESIYQQTNTPIPQTIESQIKIQLSPACCINTDGKCLCYSLTSFITCGGAEHYKTTRKCAYACNDWSIPFEATGFGCRINWFYLQCLNDVGCCASREKLEKCCVCPLCCPSILCCNSKYLMSGHICNLNICSMMHQCCVCHGTFRVKC
jgi:hypothetical protein